MALESINNIYQEGASRAAQFFRTPPFVGALLISSIALRILSSPYYLAFQTTALTFYVAKNVVLITNSVDLSNLDGLKKIPLEIILLIITIGITLYAPYYSAGLSVLNGIYIAVINSGRNPSTNSPTTQRQT